MSLAELLVAMSIFGIALSFAVTLFASTQKYYAGGTAQVDVQTDAQFALAKLTREIQESNLAGIGINATHTAILLISARNAQGRFQFYNGANAAYVGQPNWQKWVAYYLNPSIGNPYTNLVRKEGDPLGTGLPVDPPLVPAIPNNWETLFRNSGLSQVQISPDVQTFTIQDITCGVTGNPLYAQIIAAKTYAGAVTSYNPGGSVAFTCLGQVGNWVGLTVKN